MSLIDEIENSDRYDFEELVLKVKFEDLGKYVNIHDKSGQNLLVYYYYCDPRKNDDMVKYIDTYFELFNLNYKYRFDNSFIMNTLSVCRYNKYNKKKILFYKLFDKLNDFNHVIKLNNGYSGILILSINTRLNKNILYFIINKYGILLKPYIINDSSNQIIMHINNIMLNYVNDKID
jgi:hypothetical protein